MVSSSVWLHSVCPILFPQEAMVVVLKSLPSGTMLNIVGFGTTIKPLFTSSKLCTDVGLTFKLFRIMAKEVSEKYIWIMFPGRRCFSSLLDNLFYSAC